MPKPVRISIVVTAFAFSAILLVWQSWSWRDQSTDPVIDSTIEPIFSMQAVSEPSSGDDHPKSLRPQSTTNSVVSDAALPPLPVINHSAYRRLLTPPSATELKTLAVPTLPPPSLAVGRGQQATGGAAPDDAATGAARYRPQPSVVRSVSQQTGIPESDIARAFNQ